MNVIFAGEEGVSPCPDPQGKHLAVPKYSAYFSNYSFSEAFFFFFTEGQNESKLNRQREAEFTYCLTVPDEPGTVSS